MSNWEAEKCEYPECNWMKWVGMYCSEHYKERWPRTYAQLIKERDNQGQSLQAKYDALEQAARKAKDALSKYYTLKNNGTGINYAYNLLSGALLDGEK